MAGKTQHRRRLLWLVVGLSIICVGGGLLSAVVNALRPQQTPAPEQLSVVEQAHVAEVLHLRATLGDAVWPGWSSADTPLILYNDAYAFLIGAAAPPPGWQRPPRGEQQGNAWEALPQEIGGTAVYRSRLPDGVSPEAFTVQVGDQWVGSMTTKAWMLLKFPQEIGDQLPRPVTAVVPWGPVARLFIGGTDGYLSAILHEMFHAYQATVAPERLRAAETAVRQMDSYPWDADGLADAWAVEADLIASAVEAESEAETAERARAFLAQRAERRDAAALSPAMIDLERQREWLEGLAKYAEMEMYRTAGSDPAYVPDPAMAADSDFDGFSDWEQRWANQLDQTRRSVGQEGETRFYYTGWNMAVVLDRLMPGWKEQAMDEGVFLEDLLATAVQ